MNVHRVVVVFALVAASSAAWAEKTRIQCWTDERGQRACGDAPAPKDAIKERNVFNRQGQVVETWPRAPTPAELEEQEKAKVAEAARAKQAERQHAYDRYLLESYQSVHDLEATRDQRLQALEVRMELVQKAIKSGQEQLDGLVARKQELQRQGKPIDKGLEAQLRDYRRALIENPKALAALQSEHDKVTAQFESDIARYQQLKQASAAPIPPPPPTP
ncbi:MAG TPA: hypothetical protein VFB36_06060 [Nevskiaceae bacterium]|nr:hypothetical protein [Nevskiaceae bacterium]